MNRTDNMIDGWGVWQVAAIEAEQRNGDTDEMDCVSRIEQSSGGDCVQYDPATRRFMRRSFEDALLALPWAFDVGTKGAVIIDNQGREYRPTAQTRKNGKV